MNIYLTKRLAKIVVLAMSAIVLELLLSTSSLAQQQPNPTSGSGGANVEQLRRQNQAEIINRESTYNELKKPAGKLSEREQLLLVKQVKDDYISIQVLNNELLKAASTKLPLDYQLISIKAAEIKKRAIWLKENLALPELKDDKKNAKDQASDETVDVKVLVLKLSQKISSFISSPFFRNPRLVEVKTLDKTCHDLQSIIEISQTLKKTSDKLKR